VIITVRVSLGPKNSYLSESRGRFNVTLRRDASEGGIGELAKEGRDSEVDTQ